MPPSELDLLIYWIAERERVRKRREAGEPRPWSADPIFQQASFCNVERERDRVTVWIREHLREPNRDNPDCWFLMTVARLINAPEVLGAITLPLPWDRDRFVAEMAARRAQGLPLERAAYTINAPRDGRPKYLFLADDILDPLWAAREHVRPKPGKLCKNFFDRLTEFDYIGDFYAGQIIADTKFTPPLLEAEDWWTFVAAGPGSGRWLNVMLGHEPEPPLAGPAFYEAFEQVSAMMTPKLAELGLRLSAQDLQNCMCETFKLWRARTTGQMPRRKFAGGEAPAAKPRRAKPKPTPIEAPVPSPPIEAPPAAPHALPEFASARDPNAPHILFHDIETRSAVDLPSAGSWKYSVDPSTEIQCLAYAVDDEPVQLWTPGDPVPVEFIEAGNNPNWRTTAHNDSFERLIARHILEPRHGFPAIPIERRRCSMAAALASALPAALDKAVAALGLPYAKDKVGQALMRRMAKPLPGGVWIEDAVSLERLYAYCRRDVEVERALFKALPPLTADEQALWETDARINERGFYTDGALLCAARDVVTVAEAALQAEFCALTGLDSTNQVPKFVAWLAKRGCDVTDAQKGTLKAALRRKALDGAARRAIELRLQLAHASAAKVKALLAWRNDDDRVRGTLKFHGAATGRWVGHGPQPQNFKRDSEGIDAKIAAIMAGGAGLDSPVEAVGDIARAMIRTAPEHQLMIGDFSGIESRVLALVSGQQSKLEQWAKFDRTGDANDNPYVVIGCSFGHPNDKAYAFGKIGDLAFGFQGGVGAWQSFAPEDDASDEAAIKSYRDKWRAEHPQTVKFWYAVDRAAISAVRHPGAEYQVKSLRFRFEHPFLSIVLPSGRALRYPFPRIETNRFDRPCVMFKDNAAGKWTDCNFGKGAYGGIWTENIVSGIARDLLAAALQRLEAAGYPVILHVHDEIVVEAPIGFGSLEEFKRLLTALPDWAEGLPIAARAREGERFSKPSAGADGAAESHGAGIGPEPDEVPGGDVDDDPPAQILDADNDAEPAAATSWGFSAASPGNVAAGLDELHERARNSSTNSTGSAPPSSDAPAAIGAVEGGDNGDQTAHHAGNRHNGGGNGAAIGNGYGGKILCPFHDDHTPSLQIYPDENDPHYHCFVCGAHGHLDDLPGDWSTLISTSGEQIDDARKLARAHELWGEAKSIAGTLAERYLVEVRGIDVNALPPDIDKTLRFHPRCPFNGGNRHPCLVALFRDVETDKPAGIHRIALTPNAQKINRYTFGPWLRPRAIKLWPTGAHLFLGEGIETVLAAATRLRDGVKLMQPAWAAGSSGNIKKFPIIASVEELTVLVDRDTSGEVAAAACYRTWKAAGRRVRRLQTQNASLNDFNDLIRAKLTGVS